MIASALDDALSQIAWGELVSARARTHMVQHAESVIKQNKTLNLTRIVDPIDVVNKHIIDSLWLIPTLEMWEVDPPKSYLDVGSGAGWPFVPLAAYFDSCESWACEKTQKKANFLKNFCRDVLPRARMFPQQAQELRNKRFDLVTLRAVGPLEMIFDQCRHLVSPEGVLALYQGPSVLDDLEQWGELVDSFGFEELPLVTAELPDESQRVFLGAVKKK